MSVIFTREHALLPVSDRALLKEYELPLPGNNDCTQYLGLSDEYKTGYFIGARWLLKNEVALVVEPKIKNLDYMSMFIECLINPRSAHHLNAVQSEKRRIYQIYLDEPAILLESTRFEITPLIVVHFLSVVKTIVRKGLKRDYIWIEENLQSKLKGKLLFNRQLKSNLIKGRYDRNECRYQEYSVDCVENRVLKRCLCFVRSYLTTMGEQGAQIAALFSYIYPAFSQVSDTVSLHEIKGARHNSMFKEYNEALKLAQMILKLFSYTIEKTEEKATAVPPFYIDMSLLFELFALSKLDDAFGNQIEYQSKGKYGELDFLDTIHNRVIDAKYKRKYKNEYVIDDIRQLSGYARDKKLLEKMQVSFEDPIVPECVIVYPKDDGTKDIEAATFVDHPIESFAKFYKYGVQLPMKKECSHA